jgi:hypothetical protein
MHPDWPTLALMVHAGSGAAAADAADSKIACALIGTLVAPRTVVPLLRCRQSQGAMKAPDQKAILCRPGHGFIGIIPVTVSNERHCPAAPDHPPIDILTVDHAVSQAALPAFGAGLCDMSKASPQRAL